MIDFRGAAEGMSAPEEVSKFHGEVARKLAPGVLSVISTTYEYDPDASHFIVIDDEQAPPEGVDEAMRWGLAAFLFDDRHRPLDIADQLGLVDMDRLDEVEDRYWDAINPGLVYASFLEVIHHGEQNADVPAGEVR